MAKSEELALDPEAETESELDQEIVSTSKLAAWMGLTPRRLQQLVKAGILEQVEPGRFDVADAFQRYISYVKGNSKSEEEQKIDLERKRAEMKIKKARARREELMTAELEGNMIRAEDVEAYTTDIIYTFKGSIMALPPRVAVDVAAENNPAMCGDIIKKEVRRILHELSEYDYDPEFYRERVAERKKMELKFLREIEEDDE